MSQNTLKTNRRRSQTVLLPALAFAAVTPIAGCHREKNPDRPIFLTPQACAIANDAANCDDAYNRATNEWATEYGYSTEADCELGTGVPCNERTDGTYLNPMVGFTLEDESVTYQRDQNCQNGDDAANNDPNCHKAAGHVGFAYYASSRFMRDTDSPTDGVITEESAKAAVKGGHAEAVIDESISRGGFGEAAEGHGGFGEGHGGFGGE